MIVDKKNSTRKKWEARYSASKFRPDTVPEPFLVDQIAELCSGRALCLAAGTGRNAVFLAQQGYQVTAVDISSAGLEWCRLLARQQSVQVETVQADLCSWNFGCQRYDLITQIYYYQLELAPRIHDALRTGGHFMLQTFSIDQLRFEGGPRNAAHLVEPGALLAALASFRIRYYEEIIGERTVRGKTEPIALVRLVAEKVAG